MSRIRQKVIVAPATGAGTGIAHIEQAGNLYIINSADISSDTIPIKLIDNDGVTGAQAKFNGTSYQLDSSNNVIFVQGPIALYIDKPTTTNAVGVGLQILDG